MIKLPVWLHGLIQLVAQGALVAYCPEHYKSVAMLIVALAGTFLAWADTGHATNLNSPQ